MEQQDVVKHFTDVASRYDDLYGFAYDYMSEFAIKHLHLKPDDILADIGAGTGAISSLIWEKAGEFNFVLILLGCIYSLDWTTRLDYWTQLWPQNID